MPDQQTLTSPMFSRSTLLAEHRLRILGENITLTGYQWTELLESLREDSDIARRIRDRLNQG